MSDLLALAEAQLSSPTDHSNRIACWLARSALEDVLSALLAAKGLTPGDLSSTRSKLTCLEVAYEGTPVPAKAQYAWSRLSEACHHHAYELSPTYSEVDHLVQIVGSLAETARVPSPAG